MSSPDLDGHIEEPTDLLLRGWAADRADTEHPLTIEIIIDGAVVVTCIADEYRADLKALGLGAGQHGFMVWLPDFVADGRERQLDVRVQDTAVSLPGTPRPIMLGGPATAAYVRDGKAIRGFAFHPSKDEPRTIRIGPPADGDGSPATELVCDRDSGLAAALGFDGTRVGFAVELDRAGIDPATPDRDLGIRCLDPRQRLLPLAGSNLVDHSVDFHIETFRPGSISGWGWLPGRPSDLLAIEVLLNGQPVSVGYAGDFRRDLKEAGKRAGYCAFSIQVPPPVADRPVWLSLRAAGAARPFYVHPVPVLSPPRSVSVQRADTLALVATLRDIDVPSIENGIVVRIDDRVVAPTVAADGRFSVNVSEQFARHAAVPGLAFAIDYDCTELVRGVLSDAVALTDEIVGIVDVFDSLALKLGLHTRDGNRAAVVSASVKVDETEIDVLLDDFGNLSADFGGRPIPDGAHIVDIEIVDAAGNRGSFRRTVDFSRFAFGFLSVSGSEIVGFCRDNWNPEDVLTLDLTIDDVSIATIKAGEAVDAAPEVAMRRCFRTAVAPKWIDGREHVISVRVLGPERFSPLAPMRVVFGAAPAVVRFSLENLGQGQLSGWAVATSEPDVALEVQVRAGEAILASMLADRPIAAMASLGLEDRHGFDITWGPDAGVGDASLLVDFRWGEQTVSVALPPPLPGPAGIRLTPSDAPASGTCIVLPSLSADVGGDRSLFSYLVLAADRARAGELVTIAAFEPLGGVSERFEQAFLDLAPEAFDRLRLTIVPATLPVEQNISVWLSTAFRFDLWARHKQFDRIIGPSRAGPLMLALDSRAQGRGYEGAEFLILVDDLAMVDQMDGQVLPGDLDCIFLDGVERQALRRSDKVAFLNRAIAESATKYRICDRPDAVIAELPFVPCATKAADRTGMRSIFLIDTVDSRHALWEVLDAFDRVFAGRTRALDGVSLTFINNPGVVPRQDDWELLRSRAASFPVDVALSRNPASTDLAAFCGGGPDTAFVLLPAESEGTYLDHATRGRGVTRFVVRPLEFENDRSWPSSLPRSGAAIARCFSDWLDGKPQPQSADNADGAAYDIEMEWEQRRRRGSVLPTGDVGFGSKAISDFTRFFRGDTRQRQSPSRALAPAPIASVGRAFWRDTRTTTSKTRPKGRGTPQVPDQVDPLVSVCVSHFNRPALLWQVLKSLERNDYPNMEIVVVDDGSNWPGVDEELVRIQQWLGQNGGRLVRQENRYIGAARNTGFRHARGDLIIFMDDDNLARPNMVSGFVDGWRRTGADVVTSVFCVFEGNILIDPGKSWPIALAVPAGPDTALGAIENCFGDANFLITRHAFEAIAGFTEDYGTTHEDWELLLRLNLNGFHIERLTVPLFWYRVTSTSMLRTTRLSANLLRNTRPFRNVLSPEAYRLLLLGQAAAWQEGGKDGTPYKRKHSETSKND